MIHSCQWISCSENWHCIEEEIQKGMYIVDDYKFRAWVEYCPNCGTKAKSRSEYLEE